ncbi:MAG: insulinase family protein [Acidobacteria bacterium]|nr:insulinase family protein [Acidobacteriota bacterium]
MAAAERDVFAYPYDQHDFDNGLRLIIAHFFEHMMFHGTPEVPPERYEDGLQETGASSNAYTDDDRTVYHTTITKEDFERILAMEADRFRNLEYPLEAFQTEALAVLGEYNKDSAEPVNKLMEVLRDTAFDRHTYKHTTMGFLRDIEAMPRMYDYSRTFFDRFYRPEYTTLVVVGDVDPGQVRAQVERHWGGWQRGSYVCRVPAEPQQEGARHAHIPWETHTLPYLMVAHRSTAYSDAATDCAVLDLISYLGFSENSPLYERLVIEEQTVDLLWASNADHVDPYLFTVLARVKEDSDVPAVQQAILETLAGFAGQPVEAGRLEDVKSHLRYRFALGLNHSEAIASTLAHYVSLRRTPETVNRLYRLYETVTPEDVMRAARTFFTESGRTIVTLAEASK